MTEYIVEVDDQVAEAFVKRFDWKAVTLFGHHLVGEIVRCCDCKRYNDQEPGGEIGTCNLGLEDLDLLSIVEPNGFCAWGERRQDD